MGVPSTPPAAAHRPLPALERELMLLTCAACVVLLAISPIAAFAASAFLLVNLSTATPRHVRLALGLVLALALSLMAGARLIDANASNDIDGYYLVYLDLAQGDVSEIAHFGGGFEVALPLLMYVWSLILPPLSINGLMFCYAGTGALLMLIWVERSFYATGEEQHPALLGICLVMLNLYFATQLARQFLSLIVLLYAFTAPGRARQLLALAIAATFHLTAIPFYAVYLLARRGWRGWIAIIVAALFFRLYFAQLLVALDVLPEAAADKLLYYVDLLDDDSASDLGSLRMLFLLGAISIAALIAARLRPDARVRPWLAVPWVTTLVHYLLLPIPLASLRTTLMVHSVAPGLIAHRMLSGRTRRLLFVVMNVLVLYKVAAFAASEQGANLRPMWTMASSFLAS